MRAIIEFFARRGLLVNLLMLTSLGVGLIAARAMNAETMPEIDMGIVTVSMPYPGAGPEDVELAITEPIETQLERVADIERIDSTSSEGMSVVSIRLAGDIEDKEQVVSDIQKAVDQATLSFPDQARDRPSVDEGTTGEMSILELHVSGQVPEEVLRSTVDRLEDELGSVPGVGRISKVGYRERELSVLVDPALMLRRGIRYDDIAAAIRRGEVRTSGGSIESFVTERQVLTVAGFDHPEDVERVIVKSKGVGNLVRIGDVGEVHLDFAEWRTQARSNGDLAIIMMVRKQRSADTLETADAVRHYVGEVADELPAGVRLEVINDTSRFTRDMLATLVDNALMGVGLVFLVLMFFFDLRISFWVALGLPISIGLAFAGMHLADQSLNLITLMALLLMLGMLVDDAIVTGESIYQSREDGLEGVEASIEGAHAVSAPVITSLVTTMLAFAPILFMNGIEGKLLASIPIVVGLTLGASIIECKLMLPAHLAHGSRARPRQWFSRLRRRYDVLILGMVRRRYLAASLFVAATIGLAVMAVSRVPFNLFPTTDADMFMVKLELPRGSGFERSSLRAREVEELIEQTVGEADLLGVSTQVGHHNVGLESGATRAEWALITAYLQPAGARSRSSLLIVDEVDAALDELEGFELVEVVSKESSPTQGRPVEIELTGPSQERLQVREALLGFLETRPEVLNLETSYEPGKPVVSVHLREAAMAARGVNADAVTQAIRVAFDGMIIDELRLHDELMPFRLQFVDGAASSLDTLKNLTVLNNSGDAIPLDALVELEEAPGVAEVERVDGEATLTVYGDIDRTVTTVAEINDAIGRFIVDAKLRETFPAVHIRQGGELAQQGAAVAELGIAFVSCLALIYMALLLLFGSLLQPFLVMLVIPFGIVGALVGLMIQGIDVSIIAGVGMLGLAGVLVNDSVVMMSALNRLREGSGRLSLGPEAIAAGAGSRLRPVVITSVTTTAGLFPTIAGATGSTQFIVPMISTLAWGVLFGTVVTLGLLPVAYAILQDLQKLVRRR